MKRLLFSAVILLTGLTVSAQEDLIFFHDSGTEIVYDPSWAFYNDPSELTEMAGKYLVDTDIKKDGINSLRLKWISKETGDWGACIARDAWKVTDLEKFLELRFWIYSPEALNKDLLPAIFFESNGGVKTSRLNLSEYVTANMPVATWVEVVIPIADFKAVNPDFPYTSVKSLFFTQLATDGVEHTLNLDEFVFKLDPNYQPPTKLLVFKNSTSDEFFDQSWVNVTAPSVFEQPATHAEKLAVSTDIKREGNALKLTWKSVTDGNWMALTASIGWTIFDLTDMDELRFWVYSPEVIAGAALPQLNLEGHVGGQCAKVNMGAYISEVKANTWTEMVISLADFKVASPEFTNFNNIKGVFFHQNQTDNVSHTLYVDDIYFDKKGGTGNSRLDADVKSAPYYVDGQLFGVAVGKVCVMDLTGKTLLKEQVVDENSSLSLSLVRGIYVVKTVTGSYKIAVK